MKKLLLLIPFLAVFLLGGCKKNNDQSHQTLLLNKNELTLSLPQSKTFTLAVASPSEYVGDSRLIWVSGDNEVAIVNSKTGVVTAVTPGKTVIYGYINGLNAVRGECALTVKGTIDATLKTDAEAYTVSAGDTVDVGYFYTPDMETSLQIDIVESDSVGNKIVSQVLDIEDEGNKGALSFVGLRPGAVNVTLSNLYDEEISVTFEIKVNAVDVTSFEFAGAATEIPLDKPTSFAAEIMPKAAAYRQVFYRSSDEKIFTVDAKGILTPKAKGQAFIFASTSDGQTISRQITITDAANVKLIKFSASQYDISITAGDDPAGKIEVATTPAGAAPIECTIDPTYSPKNDTVSQIALVKASADGTSWYVKAPYGTTGNGSARVVASNGTKSADGKLITDTCIVNIRAIDENAVLLKAAYDAVDFGAKTIVSAFINNYTTHLTKFKKATLYIEKGTIVAPKDALKADKIIEVVTPNVSADQNAVAKVQFTPVQSVPAQIAGYAVKFEFEAQGASYVIKRKVVLGNGASFAPKK